MKKVALLLVLMLWSVGAAAHGTADIHLQLMVVDNRVKLNITVDMRVLKVMDNDKDGYASLAEIREHRDKFGAWVANSLEVGNENGDTGTVVFADVTSDFHIAAELGDRVDHARIVQTVQFDAPPRELRLDLRTLASLVPELRVTVIDASSGLKYKLLDPNRPQSVPMPASSNG